MLTYSNSIPLLARIGGGVAVGKGVQTRSEGDNRFPSKNVEVGRKVLSRCDSDRTSKLTTYNRRMTTEL